MKQSVSYIKTSEDLVRCFDRLKDSEWLAVDTEFKRERTYFPLLCLIQVATEHEIFCIDVLEIDDLSLFYDILLDPAIVKVIHSAKQDLEALYYSIGKVPTPIFDTQIAAALLGDKEQIGYAALVEKYTEVVLAKAHTRADWSKRPLTPALLEYAADDVRYLGFVYAEQKQALGTIERESWAQEEFKTLTQLHHYEPAPETAWNRIRRVGHMDVQQLTFLQHLAAWREQEAIKKDKPRKWIVKDEVLVNVACSIGQNKENIKEISVELYKRLESECLMAAKNRELLPQSEISELQALTEEELSHVSALLALVKTRATELGLSSPVLSTRKEIERMVRGDRQISILQGWRRIAIGEALLSTLQRRLG